MCTVGNLGISSVREEPIGFAAPFLERGAALRVAATRRGAARRPHRLLLRCSSAAAATADTVEVQAPPAAKRRTEQGAVPAGATGQQVSAGSNAKAPPPTPPAKDTKEPKEQRVQARKEACTAAQKDGKPV